MKCLAFAEEALLVDGRRVRAARFRSRSALPVAAARVVASGVRETLGSLLSTPVSLCLFEPVLPTRDAWSAISKSAVAWRVRGGISDGAIVMAERDARALAVAAFGEPPLSHPDAGVAAPLSPMETEVLRRVVRAVAANLQSVCGLAERSDAAIEPIASVADFATYFEIQLERPAQARIGIAIAREPDVAPSKKLPSRSLLGVSVRAHAIAGGSRVDARALMRLRPGDVVPLGTAPLKASLVTGRRNVAECEAGVRGGRFALCVRAAGRAA